MTFRVSCLAVVLVCASGVAALAQTAPPPDRVGRIAGVTGSVSFRPAVASDWQTARLNLPVTSGSGVWVAPGGEAAIGIGGNRVVLAPSTELDVDRLDDQALEAVQGQGESYFHLREPVAGETDTVRTPRGAVSLQAPGRYAIASGDTEHPTTITVLDGAATLTTDAAPSAIGPGQTLTITGDGQATPFAAALGPAAPDAFLRHALAEEAPPRPRPQIAPAIVAQMTGAEALLDVGEWSETPAYGPVWFPPVATYVPYRQGRWAFVAPWGWTWVDDAPWGFAPSHYGRWARFDGRWGWVPGRDWVPDRPPVYAPALVAFVGGAVLGVGPGRLVGWAPLGPREAYRPPYATDPRLIEALNRPTGAAVDPGRPVLIDRSVVTIVQSTVLTTSAPVGGALRPGGPAFRAAPAEFRPPVMPTRATLGATRAVLQQVNPAGLAAPAPPLAPRPFAVAPPSPPSLGVPGERPMGRPGALPGLLPSMARPAQAGLPPLRERGAPPPGVRPVAAAAVPIARPAAPHPTVPYPAVPYPAVPRPAAMHPIAPNPMAPPRFAERPQPHREFAPPPMRQAPQMVAAPHPPAPPQQPHEPPHQPRPHPEHQERRER